jgi:hypothetical protein
MPRFGTRLRINIVEAFPGLFSQGLFLGLFLGLLF